LLCPFTQKDRDVGPREKLGEKEKPVEKEE
jgi:hypothetical protein